jgi:uncharacterized protein YlxW (UPF0749 family)
MVNNVTVGRYDVIVVSGSTLPSNRFARFEYYMDLYERGLIDQIEVLKQTEVVDTEGVLERYSEMQRLQAELAQAQEQIKMLSGDLQTAQRESQHARQKAEIEKFKSQLKATASRAEAAGMLHKERMGDELRAQRKQTNAASIYEQTANLF